MYGKGYLRTGANNPHAVAVSVYSIDGTLLNTFPTQTEAAKFLQTTQVQVYRYLKCF